MKRHIVVILFLAASVVYSQNRNTLSFDLIPTALSFYQLAMGVQNNIVTSQEYFAIRYERQIANQYDLFSKTVYCHQSMYDSAIDYLTFLSLNEYVGFQWRSSTSGSCWIIGIQLESINSIVLLTSSDEQTTNSFGFGVGLPFGYRFNIKDKISISALLGLSVNMYYNADARQFNGPDLNPLLYTMELSVGYRF